MFLTEAEAERKFCPMPNCHTCTGSRCMAWRWLEMPVQIVIEDTEKDKRPVGVSENWEWEEALVVCNNKNPISGWVEPLQETLKRRRGYCGMAGKPVGLC